MNVMSEKLVGYALLAVGLLIILGSVLNVYQVFNKQASSVNLFSFPGISIDLGKVVASQLPKDVTLPQGTAMQQEIIPAKMLNESANIAAHLFLMGFVASAGYKIASLGVEILRPIQVKVRETSEQTQK
jgi:hypothetical protein